MSVDTPSRNYKAWSKEVGRKLREYPLLKTKLKTSDFKRMFRDNYTTGEAFRVAYVNS